MFSVCQLIILQYQFHCCTHLLVTSTIVVVIALSDVVSAVGPPFDNPQMWSWTGRQVPQHSLLCPPIRPLPESSKGHSRYGSPKHWTFELSCCPVINALSQVLDLKASYHPSGLSGPPHPREHTSIEFHFWIGYFMLGRCMNTIENCTKSGFFWF